MFLIRQDNHKYILHIKELNPKFNNEDKEQKIKTINDVIGNKIKLLVNERKSIGHHRVEWDATNTAGEAVSGGMYFYTIESGSFKQTKKMIHLK